MKWIVICLTSALFLCSHCEAEFDTHELDMGDETTSRITAIFESLISDEQRDLFLLDQYQKKKRFQILSWKNSSNPDRYEFLRIAIFQIDDDDLDLPIDTLVDTRLGPRHPIRGDCSTHWSWEPSISNEMIYSIEWDWSTTKWNWYYADSLFSCGKSVNRCVLIGNSLVTMGFDYLRLNDPNNREYDDAHEAIDLDLDDPKNLEYPPKWVSRYFSDWDAYQAYWLGRFTSVALPQF